MDKKYINIMDFIQPEYSTTFILGARGVGKTISAFVESIKHCYDNDQKFIYMRRYQTEVDSLGINLPLISKLTGYTVEFKLTTDEDTGRKCKMITATKNKITKNLGYVMALSTASKFKSNDYTGTWIIIYDEFIDIRGAELKNENDLFLNFAMTVFRNFADYKALFLANATNLFNCYFINYNIMPTSKINKYKELGIKVVMYETSASLSTRNSTQLARLYNYSEKDKSALTNTFYIQSGFIKKTTNKSKAVATVLMGGKTWGLWNNKTEMIISNRIDKSIKNKVSLDELQDGYSLNRYYTVDIYGWLSRGQLYFNNQTTRGLWLKFLKEKKYL